MTFQLKIVVEKYNIHLSRKITETFQILGMSTITHINRCLHKYASTDLHS